MTIADISVVPDPLEFNFHDLTVTFLDYVHFDGFSTVISWLTGILTELLKHIEEPMGQQLDKPIGHDLMYRRVSDSDDAIFALFPKGLTVDQLSKVIICIRRFLILTYSHGPPSFQYEVTAIGTQQILATGNFTRLPGA